MSETIDAPRAVSREVPRYRLTLPYWDNATLWPEGTVIQFNGTPNDGMIPLNDPAEDRVREWNAELDKQAAIKAAIDGKAFIRRAGDLGDIVAEAMEARPRVPREIPRDNGAVPVRPDMMNPAQRRRYTKPSEVVGAELPKPPPRGGEPPIHILGSTATEDMRGVSR